MRGLNILVLFMLVLTIALACCTQAYAKPVILNPKLMIKYKIEKCF